VPSSDIGTSPPPVQTSVFTRRYALLILAIAIAGYLIRFVAHIVWTGDASLMGYANGLCIYDCLWYVDLAQHGYDLVPRNAAGNANWAFFPLTSGALWLVNHLTTLPYAVCGQILGQLCTLLTVLIAPPLFAERRQHLLFSFFLLAGPFAYAYATGMSEPLFVLFTTGVFVTLQGRRFCLAAAFGFLAALTRVTGVLIAIPVAVVIVQLMLQHGVARASPRERFSLALALVAPAAGIGCFMLFLWWYVGDPLAFVHIQASWGRSLGNPFQNIAAWLPVLRSNKSPMAMFGVLGLAMGLVMLLRRQFGMGLFSLGVLLISASSSVLSLPRFFGGLAPNSIVGAQVLGGGRIRFWISIVLGLLIGLVGAVAWMGGTQILA